jgi:hypothetical protein
LDQGENVAMKWTGTSDIEVFTGAMALSVLVIGPASAVAQVPGPDVSYLAGAAVVGALIVAKWWRHK